jgi:hypothetical protein
LNCSNILVLVKQGDDDAIGYTLRTKVDNFGSAQVGASRTLDEGNDGALFNFGVRELYNISHYGCGERGLAKTNGGLPGKGQCRGEGENASHKFRISWFCLKRDCIDG